MKVKLSILLLCFTVLIKGVSASEEAYVIKNANIYTLNPKTPWAKSLAVSEGKIIAVGSYSDVVKKVPSQAQEIDLNGRLILPGFQDPHLHALEAGLNEKACYLPAESTARLYEKEIKYCLDQQKDKHWFVGAGVYLPALFDSVESPLDFLDGLIPDRPAVILDNLGHGAWANSLALEAVGYDQAEGNPLGGMIERDPLTNELTGLVYENAQQKLRDAAFPITKENADLAYDGLLAALEYLAENGVTTVSDAGGYWTRGHLDAWYRAEAEGELKVRASNALYLYPDLDYEQQIKAFKDNFSNNPDRLLRFNQAKIYVDGILSLGTGALYRPYSAELELPEELDRGFLYFRKQQLFRYVQELEALGFQLHFHAVGDRAVGLALEAIGQANLTNQIKDMRHRITHIYLVAEKDMPRFKELGVYADFQLAPSSTSEEYSYFLHDIIGQRAENVLPFNKLHRSGVDMVISSDWDAEELSPLKKIQAVLTGNRGGGLSTGDVVKMMTLDVATLLHQEDRTGSLEAGKYADFIVLDQNIFELEKSSIGKTTVAATLLAGEPTYDPLGLFD